MPIDETAPEGSTPSAVKTAYHLEAYKLLADMIKHEESVFSTRTQTLLTLNSAMVVILVGILTFQGKQALTATAAPPVTPQATSVTPVPGSPVPITIQQIVNQPAASTAVSGPTALKVPLASICGMGVILCLLWTILIM